jgi:hypothetical protein
VHFGSRKRLRSQYSWAFAGFLAVQAGGREIGRRAMDGVPAMKACPMVDFFEQKITKGTKEKPATDGRRGLSCGSGFLTRLLLFPHRWLD